MGVMKNNKGETFTDGIVLYKTKDGEQKFILIPRSKDDVERNKILCNLLFSDTEIIRSTLVYVPMNGIMFGGLWLDAESHPKPHNRCDLTFLIDAINSDTTTEELPKQLQEVIDNVNFDTSKQVLGFIRRDGKHFGCSWQEHTSLAAKICFGNFDTDNPERYLEEHGWVKVMKNPVGVREYFVYLHDDFKITREQFATLQELGLENADGVNDILMRG